MKRQFSEHMDLLCRKGFYPYEWVGGIEKLDYEGIPPLDDFYSQLNHESVLYKKMTKRIKIRSISNESSIIDLHDLCLHLFPALKIRRERWASRPKLGQMKIYF